MRISCIARSLSTTLWKLGRRSIIEEMIQLLQAPPDPHQVVPGPPSYSQVATYANYLKFRYSADMPSFISQFPRPPTHVYFDLVLIERGEKEDPSEGKELALLSAQGRVRKILERRTSIKLEDIFSLNGKRRKVILIEGPPGSGKTTLAWHICQEWEKGEPFPGFVLVIYVQLRDPAIQSAQSIADLLPRRNDRMVQEVLAEIEARDGEGVLFVLDGWDELPESPPSNSSLHQLIQPSTHSPLQRSVVMITSRPEASAELYDLASSRVHIVGFTPEKVEEYFKESLNPQDAKALVKDNPAIEGICSLPLIATIVVTLFLRMGHQLPSTLTGIFEGLVLYCILRHCKVRTDLHIRSLSSLGSLPEELQRSFSSLSLLAFQGVLSNKILFTEQEVSALPHFATLSLLQAVESFVIVGSARTYSFLHLSVQELLAAWHISRMPDDVQSDSIHRIHRHKRFASVFRFYAGLTHFSAPWSKDFIKEMIASCVPRKSKVVFATWKLSLVFECLHELQDHSMYCFVGDQLKERVSQLHSGVIVSPAAFHSLGYLLPLAVPASTIIKCDNEQCTIFFAKGLEKSLTHQLQTPRDGLKITIFSVVTTSAGIEAISQVVSSCGVEELVLSLAVSPPLTWRLVLEHIVTELMSDCPLESFGVCPDDNEVIATTTGSETDSADWCRMLTKTERLKTLQLDFWLKEFEVHIDVPSIAKGLQQNSKLSHLQLCGCQVTDEGVKCLATALAKNMSLETLDLAHNRITDVGVRFLAQVLIEGTASLKALDLSANIITNASAMCLADVLKSNMTLKCLDISENSITGTGLGHVVGGLKHNCTLELLQLDVYADVLEPLAHTLTVNKTVKLSDNYWGIHQGPPDLAEKLMAKGVLQQLLTIAIEKTLSEFGPELTTVALIAMVEEWKEDFGF